MPSASLKTAPHFLYSPSYKGLLSVTAVLERFVARAPRSCRLGQLAVDTDLRYRELKAICAALSELQILSAAETAKGWTLNRHPGNITLQDAWEAALLVERSQDGVSSSSESCAAGKEVNLLIQQAALTIGQSVAAHLQRFQLDRVSAAKWGLLHVM